MGKIDHRLFQDWFNEFRQPNHFTPEELLTQLLRRQARLVLYNITNCPEHLIALHKATIGNLCDIIDHSVKHRLIPDEECFLSGVGASSPVTIMDYRASLDHASQHYRSPFPIANDEVLTRIDILAAITAKLVEQVSKDPNSANQVFISGEGVKA